RAAGVGRARSSTVGAELDGMQAPDVPAANVRGRRSTAPGAQGRSPSNEFQPAARVPPYSEVEMLVLPTCGRRGGAAPPERFGLLRPCEDRPVLKKCCWSRPRTARSCLLNS